MNAVFGSSPSRATLLSVMALTVVFCAAGVCRSAGAVAAEFGIAKDGFTLHTTRTVEVSLISGHTEFVNEPYIFTQAGGHPDGLTVTVEFDSEEISNSEERLQIVPTRDPKDVVVDVPPGLLGNPTAVERCPLTKALGGEEACPSSTQVGVYRLQWQGGKEVLAPIVNVTPEAGQSAEFVLENKTNIVPVLTGHVIHTATGYGLTVVSNEIPAAEVLRVETTFWGVPAAPSHDPLRGLECATSSRVSSEALFEECHGGEEPGGGQQVPFLTMPANCSAGPQVATLKADSWEEPGAYKFATATFPGATGCNALQFNPGIGVEPDTPLADAPVGLGVNLTVPQFEESARLATPQLRDATVTLPLGMSVSPGIVDGIQACEATGPDGIDIPTGLNAKGEPLQAGELGEGEEVGSNGEVQLAAGHCPDASIVGTAKATTPLLSEPIEGHVYLAKPGCGGAGQSACTERDALDGNLYKLYLELGGEGTLANAGVNIKVEGRVQANPATGQLTTRFLENPQLPFSKLEVKLNGGPRAPLDNPPVCGLATTTADFKPWSAPGTTPAPESLFMPGLPDATPASFFAVEGCTNPPGLTPGFVAGTVTPSAGKFSAFTLDLSRNDREQYIKGIQVRTPPGLLGMLSSVPLCGEPQAGAGTCAEASRIGTTRVASGAGSHPFEISGNVYLTGPYDGAPFGLSVVTDAVAGPFNLGLVVVRARIDVDRENSTLTVTTDESGPHAIPQIIFGVPLRLQRVTVNIDRPSFMFNPTNCSAKRISATISGNQQAVAEVSSPFAVGGCKSLAFKPKFTVSTSGHTSRVNGASLDAKLSYPKGGLGSYANISRAKVSLPKQLPSRLTTLQKACPAATFNANPSACPAGSVVGIVRASTPLLPVGLSGPVYFVSHGGEAFPSLIVVLQGDGVRVDLTGTTFISKTGITSSTFKSIPDVPVNSFELFLPQGRNSALAANGNLCKLAGKLAMPTEFVAQNGAVIHQSTKLTVTGCASSAARSARHPRRQSNNRGGARTGRHTTGTGRAGK